MTENTRMRPDQIKTYLDRHVIGQDEAKKTLAVAVYNHYKRILHKDDPTSKVHLEKSNIILLGPTGCGKTLLVKTIAKMLNVPCYIQDTTKLTASGYVGSDVEDCLVGLLRACDYNMKKACKGIVMLDEGDKIAKKDAGVSVTRDVSGECVQQSLLKIIEGDLVGVPPMGGRKHPEQDLLYVNTTDILFILSGAFVGLDEIVARRMGCGSRRIGFGQGTAATPEQEKDILRYVTPEDLRDFGLIPEFIGRFPVITHVEQMERDALLKILTEPEDALTGQYAELLRQDGVMLNFAPDALEAIADAAIEMGTGARGLRLIMEKVMRDIMYDTPLLVAKKKTSSLTLQRKQILPILEREYRIAL